MIGIVGQEIAEAITPFVKWGAIVLGVLGAGALIRRRIGKGAQAQLLADQAEDAAKRRRDAENELGPTPASDDAQREWLQDDPDAD